MNGHQQTKQMGPKMQFFMARIFPFFFSISGLCVLILGINWLISARESTAWPTTTGRIISSEIERRSGKRGGSTYRAEVLYEYTVEGVRHSANRIGYGDYGSSSPTGANEVVNRYPKGKDVQVYYSPSKPAKSVLEPGIHSRTYIVPAIGAIFLLAGCLMHFFLPGLMRKQAALSANAP